jgi:outer membrane protein assembly factor BamB
VDNKSLLSAFLAVILMCGLILVGAIRFGTAQNSGSDSWPMFHNDLAHSGYSESTGPLTNQTLWKYQAGSGIESSPAVVNGVVYFGVLWNGHNGLVNALNAATGSKIWQFATDSGVESSPAVVDGVVYIGSYSGQVYALDAATGSRIWSFNAGGSVFPSPAVVDGKVYVGSASGDMYALDATEGLPLWEYRTGGAIVSSPAVVDGVVYVGSQDQNIYALRADEGSVIWNYTTGSFVDTSPAVVGGIVYFGSRDGYVYALNAATGSKIWSFRPLHGNYGSYYYSTPAVIDGVVYVGGYDSYIYALNATNGNMFWEFRTGGYIFSSPVVAGGVVYVGSFDGNVYALNAVTGSKIWSYRTGNKMRSSAAVANGVVYVGSGDGYLYAFWSNTVDSPLTPSPSPSPSASPSPSPTASPTPKSDLIAWWKLNEGAGTIVSDSSGNNYQGTIHGASWINNQGNNFLDFNGVSDYVSLPSMDLTNLDSLTVVAWINSDLTKLGLIIYHGDAGEFHMGNGALEQDANWLNTNPIYANFGVKLSNFNWYGVSSSAPMQPNIWHQIAGVWSKGAFLRIYVDGVLAGENNFIPSLDLNNPGSSFPSSLGVVSQDRWNVPDFFKGQISNVMIFNKALTTQEMSALYDDVPIPTVARPILNLTCKSSTSYSGFNVEIEGNLSFNGTAIPNAPILLSYSVNGGKSWQDLTLVYTGADGSYSATWLPSVTGNYLIKATYEGDADTLGASSEIVNFAVTNFAEKNLLFSVSSNSTVTSLSFNSTTSELSFTVSGPSETTGYVKVAIAKSLVSNAENIKVCLDGNQLNYEVTSNGDSWLLSFTYKHSTHQVMISLTAALGETAFLSIEPWVWIALTIVIGALFTVGIAFMHRRRGFQSIRLTEQN